MVARYAQPEEFLFVTCDDRKGSANAPHGTYPIIYSSLITQNLQKDPAYGTDVLRLWAASSEYTKDIAIGKTILTQVAESIRKFRNTARFMLGNLNGFKESEALPYDQLSRLDKFMLSEVYNFSRNVNAGYDEFMFNKGNTNNSSVPTNGSLLDAYLLLTLPPLFL